MKRALLLIGSSLFLSSFALADTTPTLPKTSSPLPIPTVRPTTIQCIDPAASAIDYSIVARQTPTTGTVRIRATVKNVGNAPYVSRPEQQEAQLYAVFAGGGNPQLVARQRFQNLEPGSAISLTYDRFWSTSNEFPPSYRLVIAYDPDIRNDGNLKNDDCRMSNNTLDRPGSDINVLFR